MNYDLFMIRVITDRHDIRLPGKFRNINNAVIHARYYQKTPQVREIRVYDVFEVFWQWTPTQGEIFMSAFSQAVQQNRGNFVTSNLKKLIAEKRVPFTVLSVSQWELNQAMKVREANLLVEFSKEDQKKYNLADKMTISISNVKVRDKETGDTVDSRRNEMVDLLRQSVEVEPEKDVILTYDPNVGRNGWYDLSSVAKDVELEAEAEVLDSHPW